jgi:aromatic-L-amino-acid/L-tryptophan decarboxylase
MSDLAEQGMHQFNAEMAQLILNYVTERLALGETPLDGDLEVAGLPKLLEGLITQSGIGHERALDLYDEKLSRMVISADSPRYFAFIPAAPTKAALLFDAVISAASLQGISWLEAAGAIAAENQVISYLAEQAGLPATAGGTFVSGGTSANLAALTVARDTMRQRRNLPRRSKVEVLVSDQAHSSIANALSILDIDALIVPTENNRLTYSGVAKILASHENLDQVISIVATGGTTNAGYIDDLIGIGEIAHQHQIWFHLDAAYGGAVLLSQNARSLLAGIENVDSFIVDPHKWLFAPFDCAAIIYRQPDLAKQVHTQKASYLDVLQDQNEFNPSDYANHLTRRARGLALWFSLITYGTKAYESAIDASIKLGNLVRAEIAKREDLRILNDSALPIIVFEKLGWVDSDYDAWAAKLLRDQIAFVAPTAWHGKRVGRLVFLHPATTLEMALAALPE